jgi:hypothetical protein
MKHNLIKSIMLLCIALAPRVLGGAQAQNRTVVIDSLSLNGYTIAVNFRIPTLIDSGVVDGLQRGFTVTVTYRIEFWKVRNGWFDQLVTQKYNRYKVGYKKFDKQYVWFDEESGERFITSSTEKIIKRCTEHSQFVSADTNALEPQRQYYILVYATLEPFTVENMEEMRKWLSGEVESLDLKNNIESSPKRLTASMFAFIKNITGFGDRQYFGKTEMFTFTPQHTIEFIRY